MIQFEGKNISLVNFTDISQSQKKASALLIMEALPEYYSIEGVDGEEMAAALVALMDVPESDVGAGFSAICDGEVVATMTHVPNQSVSVKKAQLTGTLGMLRKLSKESAQLMRDNLRDYSRAFPEVPEDRYYLARYTLSRRLRGTGLAQPLMEAWMALCVEHAGVETLLFSLHVDRSNHRAIGLYRKIGFVKQPSDDEQQRYCVMLCDYHKPRYT